MGKTISNLSVGLFGDVSHFANQFGKKATGSLHEFTGSLRESGIRLGEITGLAALATGAYESFLNFGKGFKLAADFERASVSMGAMIGNASKAREVLGELRTLDIKTPFEFSEIAGTARKLSAFGVVTDELVPTIRTLANVAAGADTSVGELAQLYIRVREEGRLSGREIREFTNAGIPLTEALATSLKKSPIEIRKMLDAGSITFPQVQRAFIQMTSEGGAFNNMLEKQADTMGGLWKTMAHEMDESLQHMAEGFATGFDTKSAERGTIRLTRLIGDMGYVVTNSIGAFPAYLNRMLRSFDQDGSLHWYIKLMDWLGTTDPGASTKKLIPEKDKKLDVQVTPHVRGHELMRWGSAEMQRLSQEWAGAFPKLVARAAPKHVAAPPPFSASNPLAEGFKQQKAGRFGEYMQWLLKQLHPSAPPKGHVLVGPQPPKPVPKGITFGPPPPEKPTKPAGFEARKKSLMDSTTSDYKDSDTYVDSSGKRRHYSPEHPNPFHNVLTPDNIKSHLATKVDEAWTPSDVQRNNNYLFQIWQLQQNQNTNVASF